MRPAFLTPSREGFASVPDLRHFSMTEAMHRAARAELVVVGCDGRVSSHAPGRVVARHPGRGATVHRHGEVAVWMALAAAPRDLEQPRCANTAPNT
jgi:beta-lactam-binding protein with PASTA domain